MISSRERPASDKYTIADVQTQVLSNAQYFCLI